MTYAAIFTGFLIWLVIMIDCAGDFLYRLRIERMKRETRHLRRINKLYAERDRSTRRKENDNGNEISEEAAAR